MKRPTDNHEFFRKNFKKEIDLIRRIGDGRNSKVFMLEESNGKKYAAKVYFERPGSNHTSLSAEFNALCFLRQNGIFNVPEPLYADYENLFAIYEYIPGKKITKNKLSGFEIDTAIEFLVKIEKLKRVQDAERLPMAAEACFTFDQLIENLNLRLTRLKSVSPQDILSRKLHRFINDSVQPIFDKILTQSIKQKDSINYFLKSELPLSERTLSPSDFGFHNAILKDDGQIIFLDFEYFGWDDPVKMISDFILHPAMQLNDHLKKRFLSNILQKFGHMKQLEIRFKIIYQFFIIKWCIILLNEFLSEDISRREFASNHKIDINVLREAQLYKAKIMLNEVNNKHAFENIIS